MLCIEPCTVRITLRYRQTHERTSSYTAAAAVLRAPISDIQSCLVRPAGRNLFRNIALTSAAATAAPASREMDAREGIVYLHHLPQRPRRHRVQLRSEQGGDRGGVSKKRRRRR